MRNAFIFARMKTDTYLFRKVTERYFYDFYSEGPKGKIRKLVCFHLEENETVEVFNLGFGDADDNEYSLVIDHYTVTNNKDTEKVLATVAAVALEFINYHPNSVLVVEGATPSRTRLYRMLIVKCWNEINQYFNVFGYANDCWEPFLKEKKYDALAFVPHKMNNIAA